MSFYFDNLCWNIIAILTTIICVVIVYFKYSYQYWIKKGVYQIDPVIPFGNGKNFLLQRETFGETILKIYTILKSKNVRFGGYYLLPKPQLLLVDPELIKNVMTKDFQYFSDRGLRTDEKNEPLTGHLLALTGTKWKSMRQKLTPTFTSGKMKMMFQTLVECSNGLEELFDTYVQNREDIDIKEILGRFTTDIIGSCAFGLDFNSIKDPDAEFRKFGRKIFTPDTITAIKRILARIIPNIFTILGIRQINKDISEFFIKVVADTIDYREKNNIKRNDFLQLLINIKNTGNVDANKDNMEELEENGLTLGEIAAQCFIFFLAGFETSSTTMSFFLYDMTKYPDIQDKVRIEINQMLKKHDGKLTYDGIMELQYLDKVLNESMRIHSSIPLIQRICTKDYKIPYSEVVIDKGTMITIPIIGLHTDPEHYPNPQIFDPERFSSEEKLKRHPFTFMPFGEGPRICIGQRFGLLQTKVGLAVLLKNHKFTLSKKTSIPLKMDPRNNIFSVVGGIWLNAERV